MVGNGYDIAQWTICIGMRESIDPGRICAGQQVYSYVLMEMFKFILPSFCRASDSVSYKGAGLFGECMPLSLRQVPDQ